MARLEYESYENLAHLFQSGEHWTTHQSEVPTSSCFHLMDPLAVPAVAMGFLRLSALIVYEIRSPPVLLT